MSALRQLSRLLRPAVTRMQARNYAAAEGRNENEMSFTLAASNQVYYDAQVVRQVDVPSQSGNFGILPKHVPTLAVLSPGIVTVVENDGSIKKVFVSSGTITVNDDSSVQVLAEEACTIDQIDGQAARENLSRAQSELAQASTEQAKAEAAIAVEVGEALVKAAAEA